MCSEMFRVDSIPVWVIYGLYGFTANGLVLFTGVAFWDRKLFEFQIFVLE
jgi:hypothetical protein